MEAVTIKTAEKEAALVQPMVENASLADELQSTHGSIESLCDALEAVADSLPASIDRRSCDLLSQNLVPTLRRAHEREENNVYPQLRRKANGREKVLETLNRLEYEHFEDLCFAEEVTDVLRKLSVGTSVNVEAVGYMLRGLFGALRRHMVFEEDYIAAMERPLS
ncbi:hemerythrin domain-containing protein [Martelella sp. HB161492]|uniref:hemerythrin domain-containing protein n=1 Tax=Martelella sp. HB161492 TaxID=2720726 RepID=UPI001591EAE6|nr:hemerythrin domain-containing protein [Martelella sp. HB161492]